MKKKTVKIILRFVLISVFRLSTIKVTLVLLAFDRVWYIVIAPIIASHKRKKSLQHKTKVLKDFYTSSFDNHEDFKNAVKTMWQKRKEIK